MEQTLAKPDYSYWEQSLADKKMPVHDGDPQCGFYRKKNKGGVDQACAIWVQDGKHIATVNGRQTDAQELWSWVCQRPISEQTFNSFNESGEWPDDAPSIGHNLESGDIHSDLLHEFAGEKEMAEEFLKTPITTQDQADTAATWSKRLSGISKRATDYHKVEKDPHLQAGREVDDKWRDLKEGPKSLATQLKRHMDAFLREQARLEDERRRKAEQEAEAKRQEALRLEQEAMKSSEDDEAAEKATRAAEAAKQAERDAQARNSTAGRTGSKVALREFVYAEITDYDKVVDALKGRDEMKELIQSLCKRAAKAGVEIEGMKIMKEKRAA